MGYPVTGVKETEGIRDYSHLKGDCDKNINYPWY